MRLLTVLLILVITSCNNQINLNGYWKVTPLDEPSKYNLIFNSITTINFQEDIVEFLGGVKTPSTFIGNHLVYNQNNDGLEIFSPIEKKWIEFNIKRRGKEKYLLSSELGEYELTKELEPQKYQYLDIKNISIVIEDDSLKIEPYPKKMEYKFNITSKKISICTYYYDFQEKNTFLDGNLTKFETEYISELLSRVDTSTKKIIKQKLSDLPYINIKFEFEDNSIIEYKIHDITNTPIFLQILVEYLIKYPYYKPFQNTFNCLNYETDTL